MRELTTSQAGCTLVADKGRISLMFDEEDVRPAGERERFVRSVTETNKADLRRLEELVEAGQGKAHTATPKITRTTPGTNKPRRPSGRRGLNYEVMVGPPGLEPGTYRL